ncbi:MAG TPA: RHS repeat-associated core domain-containing protein, partial [Thermoanaerobaculia bacterium]|nr:RHS repeat-associated core domain-containing protein [Thermoanaerobaculia bacterium]
FGNMTRKGVTGVTATTMQVDGSSNRLIGPEYDATGNLIATGDRESYTYDSLGMMSTSVRGTTERRYIYDANEERIGRINDQYLSRWTIRDTEGRVLREFKGDDSESETFWYWEQDYVYADGQLVGGETQEWTGPNTPASTYGGRRHYHLDHLSSVRMVTNDTRGAIMRHDYYPFGVEQTAAWQELLNPGDPHVDDARFTGHERDYHGALNIENVNYLDYMHARYYDPNKGRFLSVDPKGTSAKPTLPQTWNRYAYARNNPLKYIDPDGQDVYIVVTSTVVDDTRVNSKPGGGGANETVPAYKIVMMSEAGYVDTFAGSRDTNYSGKTMNTRGEYGSDHEAPPGTYFGKMRTDGKLGPRVELSDTKGGSTIAGPDGIRSNIQIHVGPGCSQGCVLLTGGKTNRNAFINSVKFMQEEERAAGRSDQIRVVVQPRNKQECSGDRCELNPK